MRLDIGAFVKLDDGEVRQVTGGTILLDDGCVTEPGKFTVLAPVIHSFCSDPQCTDVECEGGH